MPRMANEMEEIRNKSAEQSALPAGMVVSQEGIYSSFSPGDIQMQKDGQELTFSTKIRCQEVIPSEGVDGAQRRTSDVVFKISSRYANGTDQERRWLHTGVFLDGYQSREIPARKRMEPTEVLRQENITSVNDKRLDFASVNSSVSNARLELQEYPIHVGNFCPESSTQQWFCQIGEADQLLIDRMSFQQDLLMRNSGGEVESVLETVASKEAGEAATQVSGSWEKNGQLQKQNAWHVLAIPQVSKTVGDAIANSSPDVQVTIINSKNAAKDDGKTYNDDSVPQNFEDFDRVCVHQRDLISSGQFCQPSRDSHTVIQSVEEDSAEELSEVLAGKRVREKAFTSLDSAASCGAQISLNFGASRTLMPSPPAAASESICTGGLGQESRQPSQPRSIQNSKSSSHSQDRSFFQVMSGIVTTLTETTEFLSLVEILADFTDRNSTPIEIPAHLRKQFDALATKFRDDEQFQKSTLAYFLEYAGRMKSSITGISGSPMITPDRTKKGPQLAHSSPKRDPKKLSTAGLLKENQKLKKRFATSQDLQKGLLKERDYFKHIARSIPLAMSTPSANHVGNASHEAPIWTCTRNTCKAVNQYFVFLNRQNGSAKKLERTNCEVCGTRRPPFLKSPQSSPLGGHPLVSSTTISDDATLSPTPNGTPKSSRKRPSASVATQCPPPKRSRAKTFPDQVQAYQNDPSRHKRVGQPLNIDEIHLVSLVVNDYHQGCRVLTHKDQCLSCQKFKLGGRPDAFDKSGQRFLSHYEYLQYMLLPDGRLAIPENVARIVFRARQYRKSATIGDSEPTSPTTPETMPLNTTPMEQSNIGEILPILVDPVRDVLTQPSHQGQGSYANSPEGQSPTVEDVQVYSRPRGGQQRLFKEQGNIIRLPSVAPPPSPKSSLFYQTSTNDLNQLPSGGGPRSPSSPHEFASLQQTNPLQQFGNIASAVPYGGLGNGQPGGLNSNPPNHWNQHPFPRGPNSNSSNHLSNWNHQGNYAGGSNANPPNHIGLWNHQPYPGSLDSSPAGQISNRNHGPYLPQNCYHNSGGVAFPIMRIGNTHFGLPQSSEFGNQGLVAAAGPLQYAGHTLVPWMPSVEGHGQYQSGQAFNPGTLSFNGQFSSGTQPNFDDFSNPRTGWSAHGQPMNNESTQSGSQSGPQLIFNNQTNACTGQNAQARPMTMEGFQSSFQSIRWDQANLQNQADIHNQPGEYEPLRAGDGGPLEVNFSNAGEENEREMDLGSDDDLFGEDGPSTTADAQQNSLSMDEAADLGHINLLGDNGTQASSIALPSTVDEGATATADPLVTVSPNSLRVSNTTSAVTAAAAHQNPLAETVVLQTLQRGRKTRCASSKTALSKDPKLLEVKSKSSTTDPAVRSARRKELSPFDVSCVRAANAAASIAIGGKRKSWETGRSGAKLPRGNHEIIEVSDDETDLAAGLFDVDENATNGADIACDRFNDEGVYRGPSGSREMAIEETDMLSIEFELQEALEAAFALEELEASIPCQDVSQTPNAAGHDNHESPVEPGNVEDIEESEESEEE